MNYTQNRKIMQVTEMTLVVGVDIGSQWHYARAFDWRGIELTRKVFRFSNDLDGYIAFEEWVQNVSTKSAKMEILIGCEPTGHYWFTFAKYVKEHGMKLAFVNPYHVKQSKEMDDNSPRKRDGDGTPFLKGVAWLGVAVSAVFMALQLVPIPRLAGVHFCTESYILLIVWIALGAVFYIRQKQFFQSKK